MLVDDSLTGLPVGTGWKGEPMSRSHHSRSRRARAVAVTACLGLLVAACGGDDDAAEPATADAGTADSGDTSTADSGDTSTADSGDTSTADSGDTSTADSGDTSTADSGDASGDAEGAVTDYVSFVGGTDGPADDTLDPVVIGWMNQQGGQFEIGGAATIGAELAVQLANEQLGGIGGRPIELKTCFIESDEEEGTTCGQELGNDADVKAIVLGGVAIGLQSFYATIDGSKPVVGGVAVTPIDGVNDNATVYFGSATSVLGPLGTYARDVLDAKTAALIYPDTPSLRLGAAAIEAGLKAAGVELDTVSYPPNQTDIVGPLTAAGAQTADLVIPYTDAGGCVNLANALTQLGIDDPEHIISAPLCLNPDVAAGLGGDFPKWTYLIASSLFGDATDPGMLRYMDLTTEYGIDAAPDPWVIVSFGTMLTTIKIINEVGPDATTEETIAALRAFSGPVPLGAPSLECGKDPEAPAVCNDQSQFFTYLGELAWDKKASWLRSPS